MSRLPVPGGDYGDWGTILNSFLEVSHNDDGTLQQSAITNAGGYIKPTTGIPATDLAQPVQDAVDGSVQIGGDLGGTATDPQVVSTHLAAPLPISQGGTGSTTQSFVDTSSSQTIAGAKTFTVAPVVPSGSFPESAVVNLTSDLAAKVPLTLSGQQQLATLRSQTLQPWFSALANRHYATANVVCIGDSITEGQGATAQENRWLARLRDQLRANFPTVGLTGGGRGFLGAISTGEISYTWPTAITGSPSTAMSLGPKSAFAQLNASGQAITYTLTGDSADIMWTQVGFGGTFSWQVDSGTITNQSTNGSSTIDGKRTHISLGSAGSHTLTLAWVSGSSNIDGVIECNGDYAKGIQVHDAGHYGWQTSNWLTPLATGTAGPAAAIAALKPNLIIIALGVNEQYAGMAPATFQTNLQTMISSLRATLTAPYPSVLLCMYPPRQDQTGYTYPWSQYVSAAYSVATADTAGVNGTSLVTVMDFTIGPRMLGADSDIYGEWHSGDLVHPSNLGHSMIADALCHYLSPS